MARYAKPENLVKVAATKDAEDHVSIPARMPRASFEALVRVGWLKKDEIPAPPSYWRSTFTVYSVTPAGEKVIEEAKKAEENPFVGGHGEKAQKTFELLGTKHNDWFHPAVKWVRETRNMPFEVTKTCPDCDGLKYVKVDAEGNIVSPPKAVDDTELSYFGVEHSRRTYAWEAHQTNPGLAWNGNCRKCMTRSRRGYSCSGTVFSHIEWKPVEMMVGYIVWPKGVKHGVSRFGNHGNSRSQCEVCGKGINKSGRVPVAHDKDGKALSMMVGEDCARKFIKVASLKPSKSENPTALTYVLDENYEAEGEVK